MHNLQLDHLIDLFVNNGYTNLSQICHFNSSDLINIIGNNITFDEQTRLVDNLNYIQSQLVFISSKTEGYLV